MCGRFAGYRDLEAVRAHFPITSSASIKDIHDRMPVILDPAAYGDWLDDGTPEDALKDILSNRIKRNLDSHPMSKAVNKVENNSADLIKKTN